MAKNEIGIFTIGEIEGDSHLGDRRVRTRITVAPGSVRPKQMSAASRLARTTTRGKAKCFDGSRFYVDEDSPHLTVVHAAEHVALTVAERIFERQAVKAKIEPSSVWVSGLCETETTSRSNRPRAVRMTLRLGLADVRQTDALGAARGCHDVLEHSLRRGLEITSGVITRTRRR